VIAVASEIRQVLPCLLANTEKDKNQISVKGKAVPAQAKKAYKRVEAYFHSVLKSVVGRGSRRLSPRAPVPIK
jgi:hypothetical protein